MDTNDSKTGPQIHETCVMPHAFIANAWVARCSCTWEDVTGFHMTRLGALGAADRHVDLVIARGF